jgi:hypothetical protein
MPYHETQFVFGFSPVRIGKNRTEEPGAQGRAIEMERKIVV